MTQWRGIPSVPPTDATSSIFLQSIKENLENVITLLDPTKYGKPQSSAYLQSVVDGNSASIRTEQTVRATADSALASSVTTLTATVGANTAAITTEQTTRANADTALASSITSLTSTVNTNTAAITTEATTRANADSALSTSISTVSAQVGSKNRIFAQTTAPTNPTGTYTLVTNDEWIDTDDSNKIYRWDGAAWQLVADTRIAAVVTESSANASAISGINAQYSVTVSAGKVTGFKLISGATTSDFIVQADKFQIENSTGIPFKVVGSDVFINNNKVQTDSIVNNSVTVPVSAFTSAATTVTSTSGYVTVQTATITTTGEPVVIGVSLSAVSNGTLDALFLCGVFRGTTQLLGSTGFITAAPAYNKPIAFNLQDTPAAGTHTYTIQVYRYFSNPAFDVYNRSLTLLGAKK